MSIETKDERLIARTNWQHYIRARDTGYVKWAAEAQYYDHFVLGDQWTDELRRKLEREGKPVLTLNLTLAAVLAAMGRHSAQRLEPDLKPRQDADDDTARVMTHVIDAILDQNDYQAVEALVLMDGLVRDRGYFDVRMNYDTNVLGDIRIKAEDSTSVIPDPDAKEYDPDTWNQVFITRWHTIDELAAVYGQEKADEVKAYVNASSTFGSDSIKMDTFEQRFGDTVHPTFIAPEGQGVVRNVRVVERQHRVQDKVRQFVDLLTGDVRTIPSHWDEAKIQRVKEKYQLGIRTATVRRIRWTVTADHVLLYDDWSPYECFTVVPYFPVFRRGSSTGWVRQLQSPQEQVNKLESQQLHVVNTTANSGWVVEEGSIANMTIDELERRGAETGLVLVKRKNAEAPEKIQPNQIPSGLDRASTKAAGFLREISGVQSLTGMPVSPEVSGVALENSQQTAAAMLQLAFDNLDYSRRLLVKRIIKLVQSNYTEPRVFKVTDWRSPETPTVEVAVNQPDPVGAVLNDLTVGTYSVVISTAPVRDGLMESQFAEALQLREAGIAVPDEYVVQYSHLAQKKEIAAIIQKMQGRGEPTSEEAQQAQMLQQIQLKQLMAEVDDLMASAEKKRADAQAVVAKVGVAAHEAQSATDLDLLKLKLEAEKLKATLATAIAGNETKIALADKHIAAKNNFGLFQAAQKDKDRVVQFATDMAKVRKTAPSESR